MSSGKPPSERQPVNGRLMLQPNNSGAITEVELLHRVPGANDLTDYFPLNMTAHGDEVVDIPLSAFRDGKGIDNIETMYSATYSQVDPSGAYGSEHTPVRVLQVPATWQESCATQTTGFAPRQIPLRQVSDWVQAFPSLHGVRLGREVHELVLNCAWQD